LIVEYGAVAIKKAPLFINNGGRDYFLFPKKGMRGISLVASLQKPVKEVLNEFLSYSIMRRTNPFS